MPTKPLRLSLCVLFALLLSLSGCTAARQVSSAVTSTRLKLAGSSMEPAIQDGQTVFCQETQTASLKRGDIVCFNHGDSKQVKRLVGLPGETVEIRDGSVYINDQVLEEPYLSAPTPGEAQKIILAADEVYLLGDNRAHSTDSRAYGPVKAENIFGKVVLTR